MASTFKGIVRDLSGKGRADTLVGIEGSDGPASPVEENEKVGQVAMEKAESSSIGE